MKHTTRIRYVPTSRRSEAHKCAICKAPGPHKYWDQDLNAHVCKSCVISVAEAEKAMRSPKA